MYLLTAIPSADNKTIIGWIAKFAQDLNPSCQSFEVISHLEGRANTPSEAIEELERQADFAACA